MCVRELYTFIRHNGIGIYNYIQLNGGVKETRLSNPNSIWKL